jgi:raffinose/stachyose/melibiose transport system permease protein
MTKTSPKRVITFIVLCLLTIVFIAPIYFVLINSFKSKLQITNTWYMLPDNKSFVGIENYVNGVKLINFFSAFRWSLFITVVSVVMILLCTSMTAWYIVRIKNKVTSVIYYSLVFSMIVPFQMVMFPMSKIADMLHLDNPLGIVVLYLGFGAGLATFMFSGFIKSIPMEVEEAATIDGCNPLQLYFRVIVAMLKPIIITVAILETMWIWNDYLLPYIVIGSDYQTIPIAIQYLQGGYGSVDMGAMMAMLILAIIPIIIFYAFCQRYIIEGVVAGAVKG